MPEPAQPQPEQDDATQTPALPERTAPSSVLRDGLAPGLAPVAEPDGTSTSPATAGMGEGVTEARRLADRAGRITLSLDDDGRVGGVAV